MAGSSQFGAFAPGPGGPACPSRCAPSRRSDRDQVTGLVNAHIAAVVPGVSVSTQVLLSQLERQPGEFIVDPWVEERLTLVAVQRERVVAAAHLLRYGRGQQVRESYRDAGEIRWLVCRPEASYWPDAVEAGDALAAVCLAQLEAWGASRWYADGTLPAPGVYGVPEQWPHVRAIYDRIGFRAATRTETVFLARVGDLPRPERAPLAGLSAVRTLGVNGTRISAVLDGEVVGYVEVDTNLDVASRTSRLGGWADVGNLHVAPTYQRRGVGRWLLGRAAEWLDLAGVTRLLDYAGGDEEAYARFLTSAGFSVLTRTVRGLTRS